MTAVLVVLIGLPLMASLIAAVTGIAAGPARLVGRVGAASAGVSFVLAVALAVAVVGDGPVIAGLADGSPVGVIVDRLGVSLLLLVCGVSAVAQSFAGRYLAGDPRAGWFTASAGLLTGASAGLVTAGTLLTLAMCWTIAGVALCLLLGTYWSIPAAREGVARTVRAFLIGDAALWVAVAVVTARVGSVRLDRLGAHQVAGHLSGDPVLSAVLAGLVVLAALSRSAQLPLHSWLPATLAAPTPVSALLHAGVVNAGAVLLLRLSPLVRPEPIAMGLAFAAGALTAGYATLLMLTKPDIKGALTYSTMGQMGFMIMTCGLGLYAAAVFHLIAHGLYKATLFLSSGSAIARHRRHAAAPPVAPVSRRRSMALAAAAVSLPGLGLLAAVSLFPLPPGPAGASITALLVFAWASGSAAALAWLRRHPAIGGMVGIGVFIVAAAGGYVALVEAAARFLAPALPSSPPVRGAPWLIAVVAAVLAGFALLRRAGPTGRTGRLHRRLYVLALTAGHVRPGPRPMLTVTFASRRAPKGEAIPTGVAS